MLDGHIKDITSTSSIEFDTETIYADTVTVRGHKLILQIFPKGFSIIDIGYKGIKKNIHTLFILYVTTLYFQH